MQQGDNLEIRALKNDGAIYRWWHATVESACHDHIVTISKAGDQVHGPCGGWAMKHCTRTFYWFNKPYNLAEVYQPDGRLKQIYIHIASPARLVRNALVYTDYELDVVKRPGQDLCVRDEDEFEVACTTYGYSREFQCSCRDAVNEALALANSWNISGAPRSQPRRRRPRRRASRQVRTEMSATDSSTRSTEV